ncbi:hypothetical protein OTUT144_0345 [Orientia tsutsugamushi str. UT144]|uniref:Uncharacterized protein n=1 Tax=Orientia tsutsugamushi str. UT144 TaxID=1441384 RepID=A0A0F3RNM8_ORITS|nr:hypothetical protein [Orientia tsutsugamushi]KJW07596.1 hypothetical protein OTUT144_0345 [Orientia tsutsugamushi str. UT144]
MDNKNLFNHHSSDDKIINTGQQHHQYDNLYQESAPNNHSADLQGIQQSVHSFVNEHFQTTDINKLREQHSTDLLLLDKLVNRLFSQLDANSSSQVFSSIITMSRQKADATQGIMHFRYNASQPILGSSNTSKVIVRDCRLQGISKAGIPVDKKPGEIPEHWLAVIANQARACFAFTDMYIDSNLAQYAKEKIVKLLKESKDQIMQQNITEKDLESISRQFNEQSLKILAKYNNSAVDVSKKNIALIRDYCNFDDKHEHVITIGSKVHTSNSTDKQHPVIASMIVAPLSKDILQECSQIGELNKLKSKHHKNVSDIYKPILTQKLNQTPLWFQGLSTLEQDLITKHFDKITDNKHIFPTSLRNLPGLRNAYVEVRGISENGKLENSHLECRSGTLAQFLYSDKNEAQRVTNLNFKRAVELSGDKNLNIECLNTEFNPKQGIFHNVMAAIMGEERKICKLLRKGIKSVEVNKLGKSQATLNITATNGAARYHKNEALDAIADRSSSNAAKNQISWLMCKSGKDRTGMVAANNFLQQLCSSTNQDSSKIANSVMMSNHSEFLAGHHGSSRGAAGLKAGGVFAGLKEHILSPYKSRMTPSAIADTNYIKFNSPWHKIVSKISNIKNTVLTAIKEIFKSKTTKHKREHLNNNRENSQASSQHTNYKDNLKTYQDIELGNAVISNIKNGNIKMHQTKDQPLNLSAIPASHKKNNKSRLI